LLGRHRVTPLDLFRVGGSDKVNLRDFHKQQALGRSSFDITLQNGLALPMEGRYFVAPNGASMRPNSPYLHKMISQFKGGNTTIYKLPRGTHLPDTLTLLHEHSDYFYVQCAVPMTLEELNHEITTMLKRGGEQM
ncbi:hypothetical protein BDK51DRAFT_15407, partial [Blyttiomyces helicus]